MSGQRFPKKEKSRGTKTPAAPLQDAKWLDCCNELKRADGSPELQEFESIMTPTKVAETDFFNRSKGNEEYSYHLDSTTPTQKMTYFRESQNKIISKVPELNDLRHITVNKDNIVHSRNYSLYSTILIVLEADVDKVVKCEDATCKAIFYERMKLFTTNWQKDMAK